MAAVTHTPPPGSPTRHSNCVENQPDSFPSASWDSTPALNGRLAQNAPNVSAVSIAESPRLQPSCPPPVRVNFNNLPQPSDANIEQARLPSSDCLEEGLIVKAPQLAHPAPAPVISFHRRELPRTPEAPHPLPHGPSYCKVENTSDMDRRPQIQTQFQAYQDQPLPRQRLPYQQQNPPSVAVPTTVSALPSASPSASLKSTGLAFTSTQESRTRIHSGLDFGFETSQAASSDKILGPSDTEMAVPNSQRLSRETDVTTSIRQQHTPQSSETTSATSVSCSNDAIDSQTQSTPSQIGEGSSESSIIEDNSVPQLQYHHQAFLPPRVSSANYDSRASASNPDLTSDGMVINRHLTPTSQNRRASLPRPQSAYSVYSDLSARGRSPGLLGSSHARAPSTHSRKSPDARPASYAELLNVPYPQPAPAPISLDNSQLRNNVGTNAALLSTQKTLEMYRQNVKKTNDFSIQYSFAVFLIATAQEQGLSFDETTKRKNSPQPVRDHDGSYIESSGSSPQELVKEAKVILVKLSSQGYPFAQYYLADGYASGLFNKGKEDHNSAFPLFVYAAKHGHAESAYRAALCYEFGWGCRKDPAKSVLFLRTAASKRHPGAMTRLGKACLSGDLGERKYREGIKWLKLATESADAIYNAAPYQLGCLYETGYGDDIFQDEGYTAELFTQAAELGHPEANYRMGEAYEHGKLNCPRDPALSVHFYTGAAERGHAGAMMGLCAWYMVGADPILDKDEEEAYEWARRSAELGKFVFVNH